MSDGKSSSYRVVSAEELRRRALRAAEDRLRRANAALTELASEARVAEATYGSLGIVLPASRSAVGDEPEQVDAVASRLEADIAEVRARLDSAVVRARTEHVTRLAASVLTSIAPTTPIALLEPRAPKAKADANRRVDSALRILEGLSADAAPERVEGCEKLVRSLASAHDPARREVLLAALRSEVQAERERADLVARNRATIDRLHALLDGLEGDEVERLRGMLRGLPLDATLPGDLDRRVDDVRTAAMRAQDRAFALHSTREALERQGYALGEDFATVVATDAGALLPLAGTRRHGVRVRERAGRLLFNVVRFDPEGRLDDREDLEAAEAFCASFTELTEETRRNGVELDVLTHLPAGSGHIELRREEHPVAAGAELRRRAERPRSRTRARGGRGRSAR